MRIHTIDNDDVRQNPAFAAIDARRRDAQNVNLYTLNQIKAGIELESRVRFCFFRSRVYLNYRSKFIVVKVEKPQMADKSSDAYSEVISFCEKNDYDIAITGNAMLFRIKRK